ncbi:MAG: efflux RND transporter periplasmic adaptor subunit [Saprospiraceae bacterium]|nr:efflux RND transporter periplasmic adaptor subunit [Saprospiraceae bacterium]
MKNIRKYILVGIITLGIGLMLGKWIFSNNNTSQEHTDVIAESSAEVWTCSMDPQIRQPNPGKCPICGMDLIPLETNQDADLDPNAIRLSASAMHLAQVETSEVQLGQVIKTIRLNGKVVADERQIFTQSAHLPGRIERLMLNFTGESVTKGQVIAKIYSPELITAQEELFQAIKLKATTPALYNAAREKLKYWKLTEDQINTIEQTGKPQETFDIQADVNGIVLEKMVNLGDYLMRGESLFTVANLSKVWILFDAYESDLAWLKKGDRLNFTVNSLPGQTFSGVISFIEPIVNTQTRTASVRVEMANPGGKLKPEMFATAEIQASLGAKSNQIVIPKSAVLWTGKRSIVYLQDTEATEPTFLLREVMLGPALGDSYVIEQGLEVGDLIVTNGAFSIDAAAQLAGKQSMMSVKNDPSKRTSPIAIGKKEKQSLEPIIEKYLQMKDALVASDAGTARSYAADLATAISKVPMKDFRGEAHEYWMAVSPMLQDLSKKISESSSLVMMRKHFTPLSDMISNVIKVFGPLEAPLFVQFCPMANNNKGGYWISAQEQIRNPYYGDEMLTCGKVVAEIR